MLWHDLRYSLRTFKQSPMFTAAAILMLGLGMGATTAMFSVINGVLIRRSDITNRIAWCTFRDRGPD
ncbi:MAG: hypothetical protein L0219_22810 [Phycisphaerales bacterium]|nr:hypothetical protein [Phycisphaerales bacterium]